MERTFTAFISLGFACGGPQMGDYGKFIVDLTEEENNILDEIVKEKTTGYKRRVVETRYPELHQKILLAGAELARDVIVHDAVTYLDKPIPSSVVKKLNKMSYHEQADYLAAHYDLEPDPIDADVCYYLCDEEIPADYTK